MSRLWKIVSMSMACHSSTILKFQSLFDRIWLSAESSPAGRTLKHYFFFMNSSNMALQTWLIDESFRDQFEVREKMFFGFLTALKFRFAISTSVRKITDVGDFVFL